MNQSTDIVDAKNYTAPTSKPLAASLTTLPATIISAEIFYIILSFRSTKIQKAGSTIIQNRQKDHRELANAIYEAEYFDRCRIGTLYEKSYGFEGYEPERCYTTVPDCKICYSDSMEQCQILINYSNTPLL